ncbi:MFS transporter [Tsukamurella asaccharolytica]|uniref:MFS transporter n=1 Tax=Tsukamurella asaccharolytica TaxID=2592067 RepID=A0A5C5RGP6_9ACTN|nr:MFS transporter [Tsukamurella asaccharolytica]TWS21573.1 MFS transporter [Tsukamurella asaccharolytica]
MSQSVTSTPAFSRLSPTTGTRSAWVVVAMLVLFQVIAFADKAVLGLVASRAIPDLGITSVEFGFIGSAFFFLYSIVSILTGMIATRVAVSWVLLTLGLIWAVLQFPMLLGGGAAVLLVTRIVLGGAEGPATAMSLTSAHSWFAPNRRALPSNLVAAGSALGPVIAAPLLTVVIVAWGWRWAFGVLGIVGLVWTIGWFLLGGDGPFGQKRAPRHGSEADVAGAAAPSSEAGGGDTIDTQRPVPTLRIFLSLTFLAAVIGGGSNFFVQGFLTTWLPQYLGTVIGLSTEAVGIVTVAPWVVGAALLVGLGALGQRLMARGATAHTAIAVPFGIAALFAGTAFLLVPATAGPVAVAFLSAAAGCSIVYPMVASALAYAVGARQRPLVLATLGGIASVGAVISPTLVGWLMDRAGYTAPPKGSAPSSAMAEAMATGVNQAFTLTGVLLILGGALCIAFLRPERFGAKLQALTEPRTETKE